MSFGFIKAGTTKVRTLSVQDDFVHINHFTDTLPLWIKRFWFRPNLRVMMDRIDRDHDGHSFWYIYSFHGAALIAISLKSATRDSSQITEAVKAIKRFHFEC